MDLLIWINTLARVEEAAARIEETAARGERLSLAILERLPAQPDSQQ